MVKAFKFKDEEQKKGSIVAALKQLKNNLGWRVIVKALEENVKEAEKRLHGEAPLQKDETIELWQKIRSDRLQMIDLPDIIVEENKEKEAFPIELDPFE